MKYFLQKTICMVMAVLLGSFPLCSSVFADESTASSESSSKDASSSSQSSVEEDSKIKSNLVITGYKITNTSGNSMSSIRIGNSVNLEVSLKNSGIKTLQMLCT